jgi:hypothetical protein
MNYPLAIIPNIKGYKFVGIGKDDAKINCEVSVDIQGCYYVVDGQGNKCYHLLKAWVEVR